MTADVCVVVPTIREYECVRSYVANARAHGFDTDRLFVCLVTEGFCDTEGMAAMLDDLGVEGAVFDGADRERWLDERGVGEYAHLIPEASHAQTSFGLLYLWAEGFDYGVFVDDDTRPLDGWDFFGRHMRNLRYEGPVEVVGSDERWVNVLHRNHDDHGLYPRGYPYGAMGETVHARRGRATDVVASQGLWTNVPDIDAARILADGDLRGRGRTRTTVEDYGAEFVVEAGNYLTVCSMNLAFERGVVPAFYQLPMDDNAWNVGRFDDIWSGVVLKRAADVLGKQVLSGYPLCRHDKAPRPTFDDLRAEAPALELNEHLWRVVDGAAGDADSFADACADVAAVLAGGEFDRWANGAFLNHVGRYMRDWLDCLDRLAPVDRTAAATNR
ncbi:MAG: alpha-1 4-glucan-protein synthase [Haloferacaceae archaeon]